MPPVGFEPTISACERPQTYALDRAATGTEMRTMDISREVKATPVSRVGLTTFLCLQS